MTQFDDRERAFETKFARDEEMQFRVLARRNRLLGDLTSAGIDMDDARIREALGHKAIEARRQLMESLD